jgi:hypothetical protein
MDSTTKIQAVSHTMESRHLLRQSGLMCMSSVVARDKLARYARIIQWCWRRYFHAMEVLQCL